MTVKGLPSLKKAHQPKKGWDEQTRREVYTLARAGEKYHDISAQTGVPTSTVGFMVKAAQEDHFDVRPGRGRKAKVTDEYIKSEFDEKAEVRGMTNAQLAEHFGLSARQVRKRANALGYTSHFRIKKPMTNDRARDLRFGWAKEHQPWTVEDWSKVIWTDECKIEFNPDGGGRVRRPAGQKHAFALTNLAPTYPNDRKSVMIWSCFTRDKRGPIVFVDEALKGNAGLQKGEKRKGLTAQSYTDEILEKHLLPFYRRVAEENNYIPQTVEDNAPSHNGKTAKTWRHEHEMDRMVWPATSPDMNAIENIWNMLKALVNKKAPKFGWTNQADIEQAIITAWSEIPQRYFAACVDSMPERCQALIDAEGGPTRY